MTKVAKHHSKPRSSPKKSKATAPDPLFEEGAKLAREFFAGLATNPASVELDAFLLAAEDTEGDTLKGFGVTLQALLVKAIYERGERSDKKAASPAESRENASAAEREAFSRQDLAKALGEIGCMFEALRDFGTRLISEFPEGDAGNCDLLMLPQLMAARGESLTELAEDGFRGLGERLEELKKPGGEEGGQA